MDNFDDTNIVMLLEQILEESQKQTLILQSIQESASNIDAHTFSINLGTI